MSKNLKLTKIDKILDLLKNLLYILGLDSFNYLLTQGLQKIIKANARTDVDQNFFWNYDHIYVDPPDVEYGMRSEAITPHECRLRKEFLNLESLK